MSGRDELREHEDQRRNGSAIATTPDGIRAQLTDLLGLKQVGLTVVGATVFGRGRTASVDLRLSDEAKVTFERFGDISKGPMLTADLMSSVGVTRAFKAPEATLVGALIYRLAQHHSDQGADETARELGEEFLRFAAAQELRLDDQDERWRAFLSLASLDPAQAAGLDHSARAVACASVVLVDRETRVRHVRCGWFQAYVKREVGGVYSPEALGRQMARVGWKRHGTEGRIKATCPNDPRRSSLNWRFYVVPKGWEDLR